MLRYNFGCGNVRKEGYVNVDVRPDSAADVVTDAWRVDVFTPEAGVLVYSRHMLEHLDPEDARRTLAAWRGLLQPGGMLNVIVPDIVFCARQLLGLAQSTFHDQFVHACGSLWGWRDPARGGNREDAHRWGYTEDSLAAELRLAGFTEILRLQAGPDSEPWHLNMLCRRPLDEA
ncbi:MAG: hypothetical protein NVV74_07585 [Magnetospirillum sp.]|nr:hypothetical protein [Magnetospirillum sp.]